MNIRLVARPGGMSDYWLERVEDMDAFCFPDDKPAPIRRSFWWVVQDGDIEVAYAGLLPLQDKGGFLCRVGVLPSARGKGLQRRLIRARERWARLIGITWLCTYTVANNPASGNNLIKCGYKLYTPEYEWAGEDVLYWWKQL